MKTGDPRRLGGVWARLIGGHTIPIALIDDSDFHRDLGFAGQRVGGIIESVASRGTEIEEVCCSSKTRVGTTDDEDFERCSAGCGEREGGDY